MAFPSRVLATLACMLPFAAAAAAPDVKLAKFTVYEAPHYTIVTAGSEKRVRQLMTDLARFERALELTLERKATPTGTPTHIFIASGREWERFLAPRQGLIG